MLIHGLLEKAAKEHPNKEALVCGQRRITYLEYDHQAENIAMALVKLGMGLGDRVAILAPNLPEFLFSYFGIIRAGGVVVALSPLLRPPEIQFILVDAQANIILCAGNYRGRDFAVEVAELYPKLKSLRHLVALSPTSGLNAISFEHFLDLGDSSSQQVLAARKREASENDLVCILYTSGITGEPKGAMHTHRSILHTVTRFTAHVIPPNARILGTMPLYHSGGVVLQFLPAVLQGGTLVIMEKFDPDEALRLVELERITYFPGVPTMYSRMLMTPSLKERDLSSLRRVLASGAPVPPKVVREVRERMKCEILVGYGLSECQAQPICTYPGDNEDVIAETIGRPLEGYEVRIVDSNHQEVPKGEVGEIAIRSPAVMIGYWNRPEMTRQTLDDDGWLYTSDLAFLDKDGYIHITGRKSDMYIRGGYNVFPREVENVLHTHPAVAIAAVFGVPDPDLGERGRAVVVLKTGVATTPDELRNYCKESLSPYKVPDEVVFRDDLPTTAIGKVRKRDLIQEAISEKRRS